MPERIKLSLTNIEHSIKTFLILKLLNKEIVSFSQLLPIVRKNKEREKANATVTMVTGESFNNPSSSNKSDLMDNILDIREYDVPYYVRLSIDTKVNVVSIRMLHYLKQ